MELNDEHREQSRSNDMTCPQSLLIAAACLLIGCHEVSFQAIMQENIVVSAARFIGHHEYRHY